jgi:hypothetical protein
MVQLSGCRLVGAVPVEGQRTSRKTANKEADETLYNELTWLGGLTAFPPQSGLLGTANNHMREKILPMHSEVPTYSALRIRVEFLQRPCSMFDLDAGPRRSVDCFVEAAIAAGGLWTRQASVRSCGIGAQ